MALAGKKSSARTKTGEALRPGSGKLLQKRKSVSGAFLDPKGVVAVDRVVRDFGFSKAQLAATAGLSLETLYRPNRLAASKTQARLKEMLEIVDRVAGWAGGKDQAMAWYRAEPIAAFGGRTAESLVKDGKAADLRDWLDQVALGGFA